MRWLCQPSSRKPCHAASVALLALLVSAAADAAMAAAVTGATNITTGIAHLTIENYPLPSSYKLINDGEELVCAPNIITDRVASEKIQYLSENVTFSSVGAAVRFVNWTAHPSQTPGLENFTCINYYITTYATNPTGPASFFVASSLYVITQESEQFDAQMGFPVEIFLMWSRKLYSPFTGSNSSLPLNATSTDTADMLSTVELSGPGLVPFTFDKQIMLVSAILSTSRVANIPVATSNVSDWRLAAAAQNGTRRLLQAGVDTIHVDIWMELIPIDNFTASSVWSMLATPISNATAAYGYPITSKLLNATTYTRLAAQPLAIITTENASGQTITLGSGSSGLAAGAIAAIVICAVLAAAAVVALAAFLLVRRRQRRRSELYAVPVGKELYSSSFTTESDGYKQGSSGGTISVRTISSGGPSTGGDIAIPAADVEICRRPDGKEFMLGQGNFGKVYKGLWRGHHEVAVKQLTCFADEMTLSALQKEIGILKRVSFNRNIVQFYGFCLEDPPMLVMEYMEGGDLRRALWRDAQNEYVWDRRGKYVALDVARGIHFLHTSGVIHRDVKTSNVLLTKEGVCKIADVGLAITADYFSAGSATGTFSYAAPELLMGGKCSPKVDIYSFGVVLWEIITKQPPVRGHLREVQPSECPSEVSDLLAACINTDVEARPDAAEIVERLQALVPSDHMSASGHAANPAPCELVAAGGQLTQMPEDSSGGGGSGVNGGGPNSGGSPSDPKSGGSAAAVA